jgi:hypothetical protein
MEFYDGAHRKASIILKKSKDRGDTAYEANRLLNFKKPDIKTSVTSQYNSCDSKIITKKTNFNRLTVDDTQYYYKDTKDEVNNRNLVILKQIEQSRTRIHPHNVFKSDFATIDK